jgi:capsular polysaccharide biosynthesis protein
MTNVSVLQAATAPTEPASGNKTKILLLSLILGLTGGIGLAFVREQVPQRCTTPLSAERHLGLPVMVSIALKK